MSNPLARDRLTDLTTQSATEAWAVRSLARVAEALTEALGGQWAEWGEGDLADGVRVLARQRDEARPAKCHCGEQSDGSLAVISCGTCYERGCHMALHDCSYKEPS